MTFTMPPYLNTAVAREVGGSTATRVSVYFQPRTCQTGGIPFDPLHDESGEAPAFQSRNRRYGALVSYPPIRPATQWDLSGISYWDPIGSAVHGPTPFYPHHVPGADELLC